MQMCYVTIYSNFSYLCEKLRVVALDPLHLKRLASIRDRLRLNHTYCNSTGFENQTGKARSGTKTTCTTALRPCARRLNRAAQWGFGMKEAQTKDVFWRDINGNDLRQFSATLQWGKILFKRDEKGSRF